MYHVNAGKLPGNDVSRTFEGGAHGPSSVSFFLVHNQQGQGPKLHHHPYDETFIILEGRVLVQVGDDSIEGEPGDIVIGPPGALTGARGEHVFRAQAGHHLVPQPLSTGRNVYEELGAGFTLLALGAEDSDTGALEKAAASMSVPMTTIRDTFDGGRESYEQRLILVRPDQFIAWAGDTAPDRPDEIIARVTGRI